MQSFFRNKIYWLMLLAMIGLSAYVFSWCKNAYQNAKENLVRDSGFILSNAVRQLEDSLMQVSWLSDGSGQFGSRRNLMKIVQSSSDTSQLHALINEHPAFKQGPPPFRQFRKHMQQNNGQGRAFIGAISMHLRSIQDSEKSLVALFDSTEYAATLDVLSNKYKELTSAEHWSFSNNVVRLPQGNFPSTGHFSRPYLDMTTQVRYAVQLDDFQTYVLKKIASQIAISILLICIVGLTFGLSIRNMRNQERLVRMKSDLISNITHELKTPISIVGVALEALQNFNADADREQRLEYIDISRKELNRLSTLVDNVLQNSIHAEQEWSLSKEWFDLEALIRQILKSLQLQLDKLKAKVDFTASDHNLMFYGDRMHITSVVYNLLDNALKYSNRDPQIKIELKQVQNNILLSFTDNGIGIDKPYLNKIFDRFFRVPTDNVHTYKGYGLGLTYVNNVISKHNGQIQVTSEINEGTTFLIELPNPDSE